jgi:hypothetical protein
MLLEASGWGSGPVSRVVPTVKVGEGGGNGAIIGQFDKPKFYPKEVTFF